MTDRPSLSNLVQSLKAAIASEACSLKIRPVFVSIFAALKKSAAEK